MAEFDPVQVGAEPVEESFDPTKVGAVPVQQEERSIPSKIGHAVLDTLKGFVPQSVEDAALAPITMFPGVGQAYKSLSNIAFGRPASEGISPLNGIPVAQRIPEIISAEKTPALSQERFTTGAGVVADLAMIAGFKGALHPEVIAPRLSEVAGIAKPETVEAPATDAVQPKPVPEAVAPVTAEPLTETPQQPIQGEQNALQEQSPGSVLQHPQEAVTETGGQRAGVEPIVQGQETPQAQPTTPQEVAPNLPTGTGEVPEIHPRFQIVGSRGRGEAAPTSDYDLVATLTPQEHAAWVNTPEGEYPVIPQEIKDAANAGHDVFIKTGEQAWKVEPHPVSEDPNHIVVERVSQIEKNLLSGVPKPSPVSEAPVSTTAPLPHERPDFERGSIHINVRGGELDPNRPLSGWVLPAELGDNPNTMSTRYGRAGLTAVYVPEEFVKTSKTRPARIKEGYVPPPENVAVITPEAVRPSGTIDWTKVFKRESTAEPLPKTEPAAPEPKPETPAGTAATGVHAAVLEERPINTPPPGEVVGWEANTAQGHDWLDKGGDPQTIINKFAETKAVTPDDMGRMRAALQRLQAGTDAAGDALRKDPGNPELETAYQTANDAEQRFTDAFKPMHTFASANLGSLKGKIPFDEGAAKSFTGMHREFQANMGHEFTPEEAVKADKLVRKNIESGEKYQAANEELFKTIDESLKDTPSKVRGRAPTLKDLGELFSEKLREVCDI